MNFRPDITLEYIQEGKIFNGQGFLMLNLKGNY